MSLSRATIVALFVLASAAANAAPTSYSFDSVSQFDFGISQISVTGILANTTAPITVTFTEQNNADYQATVSRCVPLFLTMTEKPGRYYLNLTIDPATAVYGMISCGLQLK